MTVPGPYDREDQAVADYGPGDLRAARLLAACEESGVELGNFDRRVIDWLGMWEPATMQVIVGLVARAHVAGARAEQWPTHRVLAYLREQGAPIKADTWHGYVARHQAPQPIERGVWLARDVIAWHTQRRGRSWRAHT